MGFVNLVMGLFAAILVATGIKKDQSLAKEKGPKVEIQEQHIIIQPTLNFEELKKKAKELFNQPYKEPKKTATKSLIELDYDRYKNIRFLPEKSIWRLEGNPFQLQFLHPGHLYDYNISVNELKNNKISPIKYSQELFDFSALQLKEKIPNDIGFSGFKIHYPINTEEHTDEFAVFQGASYFRVVSEKQIYGLSARGLATNFGMPYPEDFPIFKEFWVQKPNLGDKSILVYALLDGKSAVGAFEFEFIPGKTTITRVKAEIMLRRKVDKLGIAALTSMFWYGENSEIPHQTSYPEIHDSDGLMIFGDNDEWIWRPLENPKKSTVNVFPVDKLKGFGLFQRDREFSSYEDTNMKYHLRPSAWIEPTNDWGKGSVQLLRNPTKQDSDDNIGAFWVPLESPKVGEPYSFNYKIYWVNDKLEQKNLAECVATRIISNPKEVDQKTIHIDFKGSKLNSIQADSTIEPIILADNADISEVNLQKIPESEKWRLSFKIKNKSSLKQVELKSYLKSIDSTLTETWTYSIEF